MLKSTQPYLWPSQQRELLLKAALFKDNRALDAWHDWQSQVNFTDLDLASRQLIPLLYRNLARLGVTDPVLNQYKIGYQRNWAKNHELCHNVLPVLASLRRAGIDIWLLKGTALSLLCYQDQGTRVMTDCDVLVPQQQVMAAIEVLRQLNWQSNFESKESFNPHYFAIRHAHGFSQQQSPIKIDLHWRVFSESREHDDICFQESYLPLDFFGTAMRTLDFTGHLFHVCVHGASENVGKKIQWVADAMSIINVAGDAIDWQFLSYFADKSKLSLPLHDTLCYLHERLQAPIPSSLLKELKQIPVKKIIRNEYRYKAHPRAMTFWGAVLRSWHQHARLTGFRSWIYRLWTYPRYLQRIWGLKSIWRLPLAGCSTVMQRFVVKSKYL